MLLLENSTMKLLAENPVRLHHDPACKIDKELNGVHYNRDKTTRCDQVEMGRNKYLWFQNVGLNST